MDCLGLSGLSRASWIVSLDCLGLSAERGTSLAQGMCTGFCIKVYTTPAGHKHAVGKYMQLGTKQMAAHKPNEFKEAHMRVLENTDPTAFDCTKIDSHDVTSYAVAAVVLGMSSGNDKFFDLAEKLSNEMQSRSMEMAKQVRDWRQKFMVYKDSVMQEVFCDGRMFGRRGPTKCPLPSNGMQQAGGSNNEDDPPLPRKKRRIFKLLSKEDSSTPEWERPALVRPLMRGPRHSESPPLMRGRRYSESPPVRKAPRLVPRLMEHTEMEAVEPYDRRHPRYGEEQASYKQWRVP